ncbi:MAG: radical SAM protein, partial [Patescibacteria group bacterium]
KVISENDQNLIVGFIEDQMRGGYKKINLIWFGGEPLLVFGIIENLSKRIIELAKKYKIKYNAFITTNGYLLTDEIIKRFSELKINQVYITLDGVGKTHDQRRKLTNGKPTFEKVVKNIKLLKKYGLNVLIRMNVDKSNQKEIDALRVYVDKRLEVPLYLGLVRQYTDSCEIGPKDCFTKKEYAKIQDDFNKKRGRKSDSLKFPRQLSTYCRACKIGTFVIDPNLNLYRCENDIGRTRNKIGNIGKPAHKKRFEDLDQQVFHNWSPFNYEKCKTCVLLPICMGGCPFIGIKNNDPECETYKYNFDLFLKKYIMFEDA